MSDGINLININGGNQTIVPLKKLQLLRLVAISLLFIISAVSIILFILVALSPLPELKRQEQSLRTTLAQSHTEMGKLALVDERVTSIDKLMQQKKSFHQTIDLLQSKMSGDVTVKSLRVDKNMIILTVSSKSLQSLDNFLNGLVQSVQNKQGFSQVTLSDLSSQNVDSVYTLTVNLVML